MTSPNQLDQLRKMTVVVVDSGDILSVKAYDPTDATTNPSLVLASAQREEYRHLIEQARAEMEKANPVDRDGYLLDILFVTFGVELLKVIPGRVSTEIDASLSFDTKGSIERAIRIIDLYEERGIPKERILIKLASTWEGIRAAEVLEMNGIHCNMTLLFSLPQAVACAEAGVTLISPFVGRVLDWYKKNNLPTDPDPGVTLVSQIYTYFKKFNYKTVIMGASFRNTSEILSLAGCDLLTISPALLNQLTQSTAPVSRQLSPEAAQQAPIAKLPISESFFRLLLNEDQMATEKLSEGIRIFARDSRQLLKYLSS